MRAANEQQLEQLTRYRVRRLSGTAALMRRFANLILIIGYWAIGCWSKLLDGAANLAESMNRANIVKYIYQLIYQLPAMESYIHQSISHDSCHD
jgi:hypothetical protein